VSAAVVVGRERELGAVERLLDASGGAPRALVLEGAAGIGKTSVWQAALERATDRGFRALTCRPVEAEAKLSFASLADLLEPVVDDGLTELPEPQRVALEVALLRAAPRSVPRDRRAIGTAVCSLLRRHALRAPLLVAVDDVQWLDRASSTALAFALRRLDSSDVRVLVTARVEAGAADDQLGLERAFDERSEHVRLGPLSLSGLYHVIRSRLEMRPPRPTVQRIAQASGGNPLFALELARALAESGERPRPGEPLPVPETLSALLLARIGRLPTDARDALLAAAALAEPDASVVEAVLGDGARAALDAAAAADLVTVHAGRIRFRHPLLASAVYASASADERRGMHARLAASVTRPEQQARHLALATTVPHEETAALLEATAREANARGAPESASELLELARRLTPPRETDARARRTLTLAEHVFRAGDSDEARSLALGVLERPVGGSERARAHELLARMLHVTGTPEEAAASCEAALAEAGDDIALRARIHATFALVAWHDFQLKREHARIALELLDEVDDPAPPVLGHALMAYVEGEFYTGRGLPADIVERALELERSAPAPDVADRMTAALGAWLKYQGDFDDARRYLMEAHRAAVEEGDEGSLPYVVGHLPQLELWTGDWDEAERRAAEHLELAEATAQPSQRRQALFNVALVHVHRGQVDDARASAGTLLLEARETGDRWDESNALTVLGLLELSLGNPAEAARHLAESRAIREELGTAEPLRANADEVEALLELGELDTAAAACGLLSTRARDAGRTALLAVAACARARVAAATGDLDLALTELDEAFALHDEVTVPFDLARTLLAVGQVRRRRGERKAAREAFDRAHGLFEELGARLWSERAEAESRRIPIRRGAPAELTPTEAQVAELAAAGRTNREVAHALFMSPRTVEANLSRVYRKLGIRSRAELGAWASERRGEPNR